MNQTSISAPLAFIEITQPDNNVRCGGAWVLKGISSLELRLATLTWPEAKSLQFNVADIVALDTAGAWLLHRTICRLEARGCSVLLQGQKPQHEALLNAMRPVELFPAQVSATRSEE